METFLPGWIPADVWLEKFLYVLRIFSLYPLGAWLKFSLQCFPPKLSKCTAVLPEAERNTVKTFAAHSSIHSSTTHRWRLDYSFSMAPEIQNQESNVASSFSVLLLKGERIKALQSDYFQRKPCSKYCCSSAESIWFKHTIFALSQNHLNCVSFYRISHPLEGSHNLQMH